MNIDLDSWEAGYADGQHGHPPQCAMQQTGPISRVGMLTLAASASSYDWSPVQN
jgi:hypothetical protein